jgi:hypothetical protein
MAHFGWAWDDWNRLARATMTGHLLECGTQVSGGYFADPGYKDVPDMDRLGYPIAEIDSAGNSTIFKPSLTGAASLQPRSRSNCSTKSMTLPATSRQTLLPTSPRQK